MYNFINTKCVFSFIMAVYDEKDCVNTCKQKNAGFYTRIMAIRVSYFHSGYKPP